MRLLLFRPEPDLTKLSLPNESSGRSTFCRRRVFLALGAQRQRLASFLENVEME